jgi:anti-sigma regulatory factor (Ser/Thr protein kinase)
MVADRGEPFDSGQASHRPLPSSLHQARPGGLGLRLVKAMSDKIDYLVLKDRNELRIAMHWST